jgi:hypothetical protein
MLLELAALWLFSYGVGSGVLTWKNVGEEAARTRVVDRQRVADGLNMAVGFTIRLPAAWSHILRALRIGRL